MNVLKDLLYNLKDFGPILISKDKTDVIFSKIIRIHSDTEFQEYTLHLGYESQVQNTLRHLNNKILFLIKDMENFSLPAEHSNCIVLFPENTNLEELYDKCTTLINEQTILLEESFQLFNSFVHKNDLSEIIDTASILIKNPLIVIDTSYKVLAYSKSYVVNDEQWKKNISRGYCSYEYIAGFNEIEGVRQSPDSNEPFSINCHTSPLRRYISKLYFKYRQIGYIIAIEAVTSFDSINPAFYKLLSNLVAKIVYTDNQIIQHADVSYFDSILIDALSDSFKSPSILKDRMRQASYDVNASYALMLIDISNYDNYDYNSEHLKQFIIKTFHASWPVCFKNNIVVLLNLNKISRPMKQILGDNASYFKSNNLKLSLSDAFTDLFEIPTYYKQTVEALDIAKKLSTNEVIHYYDSYKFFSMVRMLKEDAQHSLYYSNEFNLLYNYDLKNDTQYCDTLFFYLQCNKKLDEAATQLFVHKNTISYRINKLKETFDIDLKDYDICFRFYYSYLMKKMCARDQ